jgi:hypothetical protein
VDVLPHSALEGLLPAFRSGDLFDIMLKKASFGDALIIAAVDKHAAEAACFVSWNAEHFKSRLSIPALTPSEFLKLPTQIAVDPDATKDNLPTIALAQESRRRGH